MSKQFNSVSLGSVSGVQALDCGAGNRFALTATGNLTLSFTSPQPGVTYEVAITQDGTGGRTATWTGTVNGTEPSPPGMLGAGGLSIYTFIGSDVATSAVDCTGVANYPSGGGANIPQFGVVELTGIAEAVTPTVDPATGDGAFWWSTDYQTLKFIDDSGDMSWAQRCTAQLDNGTTALTTRTLSQLISKNQKITFSQPDITLAISGATPGDLINLNIVLTNAAPGTLTLTGLTLPTDFPASGSLRQNDSILLTAIALTATTALVVSWKYLIGDTGVLNLGNKTGALALNLANGKFQQFTATGDITALTVTGATPGEIYVVEFIQDNPGGRTLALGVGLSQATGVTITPGAGVGAISVYTFIARTATTALLTSASRA